MPQPTLFNFFQRANPKSTQSSPKSSQSSPTTPRSVLSGDSGANARKNDAHRPHLATTPRTGSQRPAKSSPSVVTPADSSVPATADPSVLTHGDLSATPVSNRHAKRLRDASKSRAQPDKKYRRVRLASDSDENGAVTGGADKCDAPLEDDKNDVDVSFEDSEEFKPGDAESSSDSGDTECVSSDRESPAKLVTPKRRPPAKSSNSARSGGAGGGGTPLVARSLSGLGVSPRTPGGSHTALKHRLSSFSAESRSEASPSSASVDTGSGAVCAETNGGGGGGGGSGGGGDQNWPHLSLEWLKGDKIRDADGRRPDHVDYNARSLRVPLEFLDKQTPAMRQWWQLKSTHFDCVLFFKMGKFYEMFHMDAVLCVKELGLLYMKGDYAHVGFPEASFARYSSALVAKGYTVCRIEQTETPDMMQRRVSQASRVTRFDRVVAREICQLTSRGTRTYSAIEGECADSQLNYLMAVVHREGEAGEVEFGVCFVDTSVGQFCLGSFSDDCHCSRLRTLIAHHTPVQLLLARGSEQLVRSVAGAHLSASGCTIESLRPNSEFWSADNTLRYLAELDCFTSTSIEGAENGSDINVGKGIATDSAGNIDGAADMCLNATEGEDGWPSVLLNMTSKSDSLHQTARPECELALRCLGAVLWCLQRSLLHVQLVSMKRFSLYTPPDAGCLQDTSDPVQLSESPEQSGNPADVSNADTSSDEMDDIVPPKEFKFSLPKHMVLDGATVSNLELVANSVDGSTDGTLLGVLDTCVTPFGKRLLRAWLCAPLTSAAAIDGRLDAVEELMAQPELMQQLTDQLKQLPDLDRQLRRIHVLGNARLSGDSHPSSRAIMFEGGRYSRARVNDFLSALAGFQRLQTLVDNHNGVMSSALLASCLSFDTAGGRFPHLADTLSFFQESFDQEQARRDGRVVPSSGVDSQYDSGRQRLAAVDDRAADYLRQQCRRFGTKVVYFGSGRNAYQLELSDSAAKRVDSSYELQSQRKGFKRYWTSVTKELLAARVSAEEQIDSALRDVTRRLFAAFCGHQAGWQLAVQCAALLDSLLALARYSRSLQPGCRPHLLSTSSGLPVLELTDCAHPWLGRLADGSAAGGGSAGGGGGARDFIANDVVLAAPRSALLLTGPNMGGKSTLMRQVGLAVILAQMGCYVPAASARLTPADRVFTRLGAHDSITTGQSTFHVELSETGAILRHATCRSLVLVDELGRGTSTFDGSAIASAVLRQLLRIGATCLFSTHYHTLVAEFESLSKQVWLAHMSCMVENENADDPTAQSITFLYRLADGACPRSYGFNVAQLAGLPLSVVRRGHQVARQFQQRVDSVARFCRLWRHHFDATSDTATSGVAPLC